MNEFYQNKQQRALSDRAEDASSEGMMSSTRSISSRRNLMATVVKAASAVNNILIENCGICTVYCDKQVQYEEYVQQQYDVGTGAMGHLYSQLNGTAANAVSPPMAPSNVVTAPTTSDTRNVVDNSDFVNPTDARNTPPNHTLKSKAASPNDQRIEVERYYREFLFDEESVVRSVGSRGVVDDEE